MWHVQMKGEMHTALWWGDPRKRDHLEDHGKDRWTVLKCVLNKRSGGTGRIQLTQEGGHIADLSPQWPFGCHKTRWVTWHEEELLAAQERLCSMELAVVKMLLSDQHDNILDIAVPCSCMSYVCRLQNSQLSFSATGTWGRVVVKALRY
jgi:hypothetical protein